MADDRYDWLDEEAAERLLRGEPAGSPDGVGAAELTALLDTAAAAGRGTSGDAALPGEEAAVAAFRQARGDAPAPAAAPTATDGMAAVRTPRGAGPATRRLGRPLRRGFMVALAGCALGGVAVAAGAGVLPTPFRGGTGPDPATSVSAAESPGPLATDTTGTATDGATRMPDPTHGADRPDPLITDNGSDGGNSTPTPDPGRGTPGPDATGGGTTGDRGNRPDDPKGKPDAKEKRRLGVTFCRTYESGKRSVLDQDTLRRLERAAGGPEKVHAFCRQYLSHTQEGGRYDGDGRGGHGGHGQGGHGAGHGGKGGKNDDEDDDSHRYAPSAGRAAPFAPDPAGTVTTTPAAPDELRLPGAPPVAPV
ncbi:hypothetical protein [Streptomyces sp. NPDC059788]|uniref:hypothetical protein n=1 Tax=Streptomyces sp. NPDC059788 TaxID=3346948 RepID=UPI0036492E53